MLPALRKAVFSTSDAVFNDSLVLSQKKDLEFILRDPSEGHRRTQAYLSNLLEHATSSTKHYRAWRGASLQQFPVVNKDSYRNAYDSFLSDHFRNEKLHSMSTSGSTGTPFSVVQDKRKRSRVVAELKVFAERAGVKSYEPMAFLRVLSAKTRRSWFQQYRENLWRIDSPNLDEESLRSFRNFLKRKGIKSLLSYPSTYDVFVDYLLQCGDDPDDFYVESVIGGGRSFLKRRDQN
jgi:phenylacetate-CoA ligase